MSTGRPYLPVVHTLNLRDGGAEDDDDPELMRNNQYERIAEAARNHIAT